ncbi:MAG TPA: DegQ family serine endoprotease [Steroidobacteraceae bacterium]|nr:DegQ family serine endoprotease [Steroidobacteraceae bacterium]
MHTAFRLRRAASGRSLAAIAFALSLTAIAPAGIAQPHLPSDVNGAPLPSLAPIVKRASPAVVNVATRGTVTERGQRNPLLEDPFFRRFFDVPEQGPRQRQFQSAGSGVVVDAKQGLIVTNAHVVENATEITVTTIDGRDYKATVVGSDSASDVAVVKVKDAKLAEIPLGDSSKAEVGDFVLAIGNPFGLQHTVTYGIVSALGRSGINPDGYEDFIQTDASINPGNSGGALINLRGELIGINSAILSRSGGNIGIGFAIPSNMVRSVMEQLVKYGEVKRGILGVNIVTLTPDIAESLGSKDAQGALVSQVVEGSAAEKAGIKAGDIITTVNGQPVKSAAELRNHIGLLRVGEGVDIALLRDGQAKRVAAVVQARSGDHEEGSEGGAADIHRAFEGADLADAPGGGVLVRAIESGSPASQTQLRANDVITNVNRQRVNNLKELRAAAKNQTTLLVTVRRGTATALIPIR